MPTLNKALRVYNEITIQHLLSAEGKLIWRDPLEGYHEYYVNPEIASIYMGLKRLFIDWIDPLKKTYQDEWWHIKKAPSFKTRKLFYKLEQLRFHMELNMLKALIIWTKEGFSLQTILQETVRAKEYLAKMEKLILEDTYINPPEGYTHKLSERRLAVKIQFVLTEKSFSAFPEHYRWSND